MFHQARVICIVAPQLGQIIGMVLPVTEQRGKAGQASVHRVAPDMDDLCIGQHQVNQADGQEIGRHLVGDAPRFRRAPLQPGHIFRAPGGKPRLVERAEVIREDCACNIVP